MKRVTRINVIVGRFGVEPQNVEVSAGATVQDVLDEVGLSLSRSEKVWVGGEKAVVQDVVEEGDILNVVGSKEGGR